MSRRNFESASRQRHCIPAPKNPSWRLREGTCTVANGVVFSKTLSLVGEVPVRPKKALVQEIASTSSHSILTAEV